MEFFHSIQTSASGLSAQRLRMNLISGNLANVNTTRTLQGGPYRRKEAIFAAASMDSSFNKILTDRLKDQFSGVRVDGIHEDQTAPLRNYNPSHPHADDDGFVSMPNIKPMEEMVNMISASRGFEANVTAIKAAKEMALKALEIGR